MPFSSFSIDRNTLHDRRTLSNRRHLGERRNNQEDALEHHAGPAETASLRFASPPEQEVNGPAMSQTHWQAVAEAAYFKAEKRGFLGGSETEDWLQAEQETRSALE